MPIKRQIRIYNEVINPCCSLEKRLQYEYYIKFEMFYIYNDKFKSMESVKNGSKHPYSHHSWKRDRKTVFLRSAWPSSWVLGQSDLLRKLSKSKNIKCEEEYKMENFYL